MFNNSFCFLFWKTCFEEYKEKAIFLFFWNKKYFWLVEIKKYLKKIKNTKIYCYYDLNSNTNLLNETNLLNQIRVFFYFWKQERVISK